jgi:WXG100 family type VII secretion target
VANLQVTTAELVAVSSELSALAGGLRSGLGTLDGDVTDLLGTGWSGSAASAYSDVWREWHEGAAHVIEGLSRMAGLLQEAADRYSSADTVAAAEVSEAGL